MVIKLHVPLRVIGSTTSGNMLYEGNLIPHGEYRLTNYSGSTDLVVASTADFELRAHSIRGKVESDFPLNRRHKTGHDVLGANSLFGTHSKGDATVVLGSYEGNISVRRQH